MILTFKRKDLLEIIATVEAGTGHRVPNTGYDNSCPLETTPGLLLCGGWGVYFMGNNSTQPDAPFPIADANEANVSKMFFHECEQAMKAVQRYDGTIFIELERVKSKMLEKTIPYINITPESFTLGCVGSLDELADLHVEEPQPVVEIGDLDDLLDVDGSWKHYRGQTEVSFEFASKEVSVAPDEYDIRGHYIEVDFYLDSRSMWAKCSLDGCGELRPQQMDLSSATINGYSLITTAVGEMIDAHDEFATQLAEEEHRITCKFNPNRLPDGLSWDGFQELLRAAFHTIAPNSTLVFEVAEGYCLEGINYWDDAFLQFLLYKWIVKNHPEISPHRWLVIHTAGPNNCFPDIIIAYYGWPKREVYGMI